MIDYAVEFDVTNLTHIWYLETGGSYQEQARMIRHYRRGTKHLADQEACATKTPETPCPEESDGENGGEASNVDKSNENEDFHDAREERQESPSSKPAACNTSLPDEVKDD